MAATRYEILAFIGRGVSARDYHRLKAALDRLQSTNVATSLRLTSERRMHRFSWIKEWTERADAHGRADGIDLIVPDWFYRAVLDDALVLTINREYFALTGGLERWLYWRGGTEATNPRTVPLTESAEAYKSEQLRIRKRGQRHGQLGELIE